MRNEPFQIGKSVVLLGDVDCMNGEERPSGVVCPTDGILHPLKTTISSSNGALALAPGEKTLADAIADKLLQREGAQFDSQTRRSLLTLSGGGQCGAYSAGFPNSWTKNQSRPSFNVVTGVSTGALVAPFAFLGSDYNDELEQAYTIDQESDLVRERGLLELLSTNAFLMRTGLERRVDALVDTELLTRLANAEQDRGLFIGIVDADSGEFLRCGSVGSRAC